MLARYLTFPCTCSQNGRTLYKIWEVRNLHSACVEFAFNCAVRPQLLTSFLHKPATTQSGFLDGVRLRVVSRVLAAIARLYTFLRFWPYPAQAVHTGYP